MAASMRTSLRSIQAASASSSSQSSVVPRFDFREVEAATCSTTRSTTRLERCSAQDHTTSRRRGCCNSYDDSDGVKRHVVDDDDDDETCVNLMNHKPLRKRSTSPGGKNHPQGSSSESKDTDSPSLTPPLTPTTPECMQGLARSPGTSGMRLAIHRLSADGRGKKKKLSSPTDICFVTSPQPGKKSTKAFYPSSSQSSPHDLPALKVTSPDLNTATSGPRRDT